MDYSIKNKGYYREPRHDAPNKIIVFMSNPNSIHEVEKYNPKNNSQRFFDIWKL